MFWCYILQAHMVSLVFCLAIVLAATPIVVYGWANAFSIEASGRIFFGHSAEPVKLPFSIEATPVNASVPQVGTVVGYCSSYYVVAGADPQAPWRIRVLAIEEDGRRVRDAVIEKDSLRYITADISEASCSVYILAEDTLSPTGYSMLVYNIPSGTYSVKPLALGIASNGSIVFNGMRVWSDRIDIVYTVYNEVSITRRRIVLDEASLSPIGSTSITQYNDSLLNQWSIGEAVVYSGSMAAAGFYIYSLTGSWHGFLETPQGIVFIVRGMEAFSPDESMIAVIAVDSRGAVHVLASKTRGPSLVSDTQLPINATGDPGRASKLIRGIDIAWLNNTHILVSGHLRGAEGLFIVDALSGSYSILHGDSYVIESPPVGGVIVASRISGSPGVYVAPVENPSSPYGPVLPGTIRLIATRAYSWGIVYTAYNTYGGYIVGLIRPVSTIAYRPGIREALWNYMVLETGPDQYTIHLNITVYVLDPGNENIYYGTVSCPTGPIKPVYTRLKRINNSMIELVFSGSITVRGSITNILNNYRLTILVIDQMGLTDTATGTIGIGRETTTTQTPAPQQETQTTTTTQQTTATTAVGQQAGRESTEYIIYGVLLLASIIALAILLVYTRRRGLI